MSNLPPTDSDTSRIMAEALRAQMPGLKTQAQFTAFMIGFDSFRLLMDAVFTRNPEREAQARDAFEKALLAARQATDISEKFQEIPTESRTAASNPFTQPPQQFFEYDIHKKLMAELENIDSAEKLTAWYQANKEDRDRIISQTLRNTLIDSIRAKRLSFEKKGD